MTKRTSPHKDIVQFPRRVENQRERREFITRIATDILFYLDKEAWNERIVAIEDILGEFYDELRAKDERIEKEWKLIRG